VKVRKRVVGTVVAVVALLGGIGLYVGVRSVERNLTLGLRPRGCTIRTDHEVLLKPDQAANAATITAVAVRRGLPDRAVVVALATALQESKLENLPGGDRDSVGLFQQRPSQGWGTAAQISDPRYAAGKFYTALQKVRGWQRMDVTVAAQTVQRSAHPEAYQKWADEAEVLAGALLGHTAGAVSCFFDEQPTTRGRPALAGLLREVRLDWGDAAGAGEVGAVGLVLSAADATTGWQYAHWLVAHARDSAVRRVRYGNQEWTADRGQWSRAAQSAAPANAEQVVAEVWT
jgi:hypothetical protein